MKQNKIALSALSAAALALAFSACGQPAAVNNSAAANAANKSNTATVVNTNQTTANKTAPGSNTASNSSGNSAVNKTSSPPPPPAGKSEADNVEGELQVGKTESVILYVGMESGDYAAYCFANDSEAGRAILAGCKDKEKCEVSGKVDHEAGCKVPGLEADLSASGRILKVNSVKSLGRK